MKVKIIPTYKNSVFEEVTFDFFWQCRIKTTGGLFRWEWGGDRKQRINLLWPYTKTLLIFRELKDLKIFVMNFNYAFPTGS